MERNRRKTGRRRRRAGVRAIRRLRKLDPVVAGLGALIVVLSVAWGSFYWKEASGRSPVAYGEAHAGASREKQEGEALNAATLVSSSIPVAGAEADYEKAYEARSESKASARAPDEAYRPPDAKTEASPAPSGADDELPGEPKPEPEPSGSPEEKYGREIEKTQESCAALLNGKTEEAEEAFKRVDRGNPLEAKAWSDTWTGALSEAAASCDEAFAGLAERARGESISQGMIDEWTSAYETRKTELQADARSKLRRLLGG